LVRIERQRFHTPVIILDCINSNTGNKIVSKNYLAARILFDNYGAAMLVIGIDENGLGPLLGPLVVTAAVFEADQYNLEMFWRSAGRARFAADSKQVFSASKLGSAEVATLTWLREFGKLPSSYIELADLVFESPPLPLPCQLVPSFCTPSSTRLPVWADADDSERISDTPLLRDQSAVIPVTVGLYAICPGLFNLATREMGLNKFALDCRLMLKLFDHLSRGYDGEVLGLFGKVGSARKYGPWLQDANIGLWMAEEETRDISTYRIAPRRTVSFIRDGDAAHLPIAVASMIGKYARELAMHDLNTLLATPGVRKTSGYHNHLTAVFVEKTKEKRAKIGLNDHCFLRNS
jgi:ribonuclease HII